MKRLSYIFLMVMTCVSCAEFYHPHFKEATELMTMLDTLGKEVVADRAYIGEEGGEVSLNLYSNGKVSVRLMDEEVSWLRLMCDNTIEGDGRITVSVDPNTSFRRMAEVAIELEGGAKKDTLRFYQLGEVPVLGCEEPFLAVDGRSDVSASFTLTTNISPEDMMTALQYSDGGGQWLEYSVNEDGTVTVDVKANESDKVTTASIALSFADGWKSRIGLTLRVTRSDRSGGFGQPMSFESLRAMATEEGFSVEEDIMMEGIVISSCESLNMELNPEKGYSDVDVLENERTAYISSLDAAYGFRLKFTDHEDNVFLPGTKVMMSLKGTVLTKELDPERYTISGLSYANMLGSTAGVAVPEKRKRIADLTDEDIYTFVEIENTEFLNKVGSYSNVKEQFSLPSSFNTQTIKTQMDGWASMLVDVDGNTIFAMVNMMCPWRRTGSGVPQGIGSVKGIIVHHDHRRYDDLGDYQIRVLDESGFCQSETAESNYEDICLWGYFSGNSKLPQSNDGTATLYLENQESPVAPGTCQSFNALDCSGTGVKSGHAFRVQGDASGWYKWNEDGTVSERVGVRMELSTADVTSGSLYAYISMSANGTDSSPLTTFKNFPAHWCLEYSVDGENYTIVEPAVQTGKPYVHMKSGPWTSVAIGKDNYQTSAYCAMGYTEHLFALPDDALGQETLYVRLCPYDTVRYTLSKDWDAPVETGVIYPNTDNMNDIRFSAIRFLVKR